MATPGRPLDAATRGMFEARLGQPLGDIRVHADAPAAASATSIGSRAYAVGRHLVFGPEQYQPTAAAGRDLIAHELTHAAAQATGTATLQRAPADEAAAIPASDLLGLPTGSKVVVTRSMQDMFFKLLSSQAPDVAVALTAVSNRQATVVTATADLIEIRFDQPAELAASGKTAARSIRDLTIRLKRSAAGSFDFVIAGTEGDPGVPATLYEETALTARAESGAFVLSAGSEPHLRLTPAGSQTGTASIEAFTAPYLAGQPGFVRKMTPERVGLISVTGLPSAPAGSPDTEAAAQRIIDRAASQRAPRRHTLTIGGGIVGGTGAPGVGGLLGATWRYSFQPWDVGELAQIPLQVDIFYAPTPSVIGAISSGFGTSLSSLHIPINVRLNVGLGGGAVEGAPGPAAPEAAGPTRGVFGPTLGAGIGYERGWFRMEVRWDQLINVLPGPGPGSVPMGSLHLGGSF